MGEIARHLAIDRYSSIWAGVAGCVTQPRYFVGTRAFNSSNQCSTTWICGASGAVASFRPASTVPMNRLPSGVMSYCRSGTLKPNRNGPGATTTGFPNANVGCVVTLTTLSWSRGRRCSKYSSFPSRDHTGWLPVGAIRYLAPELGNGCTKSCEPDVYATHRPSGENIASAGSAADSASTSGVTFGSPTDNEKNDLVKLRSFITPTSNVFPSGDHERGTWAAPASGFVRRSDAVVPWAPCPKP